MRTVQAERTHELDLAHLFTTKTDRASEESSKMNNNCDKKQTSDLEGKKRSLKNENLLKKS